MVTFVVKKAFSLVPGDYVQVAHSSNGTKKVQKVQYLKDNVRVRVTFDDRTDIVLKEFDNVYVLGDEK